MKNKRWIKDHNDRLYRGYIVDVKSYLLEEAQLLNIPIKVSIGKPIYRWVTIAPVRFREGIGGSRLWKSKQRNGKDYYLVSFSVTSDVEKKKQKEVEPQVSLDEYFGNMKKLLANLTIRRNHAK